MQRHRTIAALLLALLLTSAQAKDKGPALFVTITAPAAGQPLHDAATYQVDVEFLRDEVPLVLTIAIDPRLAVQGVTATAGISCEVTAPIVCTGVIDSARPATVWADVRRPENPHGGLKPTRSLPPLPRTRSSKTGESARWAV